MSASSDVFNAIPQNLPQETIFLVVGPSGSGFGVFRLLRPDVSFNTITNHIALTTQTPPNSPAKWKSFDSFAEMSVWVRRKSCLLHAPETFNFTKWHINRHERCWFEEWGEIPFSLSIIHTLYIHFLKTPAHIPNNNFFTSNWQLYSSKIISVIFLFLGARWPKFLFYIPLFNSFVMCQGKKRHPPKKPRSITAKSNFVGICFFFFLLNYFAGFANFNYSYHSLFPFILPTNTIIISCHLMLLLFFKFSFNNCESISQRDRMREEKKLTNPEMGSQMPIK